MFIINQDRDDMILLYADNSRKLRVKTICNRNKLFGFNLMFGSKVLGTFETYEEAEREFEAIRKYTEPYYVVSGYEEWD